MVKALATISTLKTNSEPKPKLSEKKTLHNPIKVGFQLISGNLIKYFVEKSEYRVTNLTPIGLLQLIASRNLPFISVLNRFCHFSLVGDENRTVMIAH